jgi:hypothetical protein
MKAFLETLRRTANITSAASSAGIERTTAYLARNTHPDFSAAWDEAIEIATDALELEARRRAMDGWDEPVFQGGMNVGTVRKYSDRLLEMQLYAHRPAKYRNRSSIEHSGPNGGPIETKGSIVIERVVGE